VQTSEVSKTSEVLGVTQGDRVFHFINVALNYFPSPAAQLPE
jgi:hypothetical protein